VSAQRQLRARAEAEKPVEYQPMGLQVLASGVIRGGIAVLSILNARNNAEPINKALALKGLFACLATAPQGVEAGG
jgi:hypothetical protein